MSRRAPKPQQAVDGARELLQNAPDVFAPGCSIDARLEYFRKAMAPNLSRHLTDAGRDMATVHWREMVVKWALRGDRSARQACLEAAAREISEGQPLSGAFADFIAGFLQSSAPRQRGNKAKDPNANFLRDLHITIAVSFAADEGALNPTRNATARQNPNGVESGCSIVAKLLPEFGLNLSEGAVEKIWHRCKD